MRVVFRADASQEIGSGHVARCLVIARLLRARGAQVSFLCRELQGHLCDFVERQGFEVHRLPRPEAPLAPGFARLAHAAWLGVSWEEDAAQAAAYLSALPAPPDWLVVDHYALDARWEEALRPHFNRLMVIDDLADRPHACDLLLDQNLHPGFEHRYEALVPAGCRLLLGSRFALLRPEFAWARRDLRLRSGALSRLLVFYGGSDPTNETLKALRALRSLADPAWRIDVVLGAANPHREAIEAFCRDWPQVALHTQVDRMAELMASADLALGAGGVTTWERAALGLPCVASAIAYNQESILRGAAEAGILFNLGKVEDVTEEAIAAAIENLAADPAALQAMGEAGRARVDEWGAFRVLAELGAASYRITVVSDASSWINAHVPEFVRMLEAQGHHVSWVHEVARIPAGDFVFYWGCGQIVSAEVLARNRHNLVIHESALPHGKGWSPLTWQILEGRAEVPVTLFEAMPAVDSGPIYLRGTMRFRGTELVDELRAIQAQETLRLSLAFIEGYPEVVHQASPQLGDATYYPRRTREDSRLDPERSLADQMNLLRVVDNERYPAFFDWGGERYVLAVHKADAPQKGA
ncbi:MAG TPA: UDP-2,4-diacetamido-2,4,6-trideoxy-beta-L-altropyranose hydrolase [Pantanalinema sp.]